MTSKFIIYGFLDPRPHKLDQLRYVGKSETGLQRCREHLKPSSLEKDTRKDRWIKLVLSEGLKPIPIVLEEHSNKDDLFEAEKFWIAYYRGLGCDLTNSTDGGEGSTGYKHKEETKQKIADKQSIFRKGKPLPQGMNLPKEHKIINGLEYRNCGKCLKDVEIVNFGWIKVRQQYQSYCKSCHLVAEQEWRKANPAPTLPEADYNASRLPGARAGGEASKRPERRLQAAKQRSKAIQATNLETGEVLTFESALKAKEHGFQNSNIGQSIKYNKPYKGYTWKFI